MYEMVRLGLGWANSSITRGWRLRLVVEEFQKMSLEYLEGPSSLHLSMV